MDFGFGAFLEKFEEHCGRFATKCLVIIIGMAVCIYCTHLIYAFAVAPLVSTLSAYWSAFGSLGIQIRIFLVVWGVVGGGLVGALFGADRASHAYEKHYESVFREMTGKLESANAQMEEIAAKLNAAAGISETKPQD
jgi:hypothetical protein